MKKSIKFIVFMLVLVSMVSLSISVSNNKPVSAQQNMVEEFTATDFVVFTNDLETLTEKKVMELAQVNAADITKVSVDKDQFTALKGAKAQEEKKVSFLFDNQVISVTATVKSSTMSIAPASTITDGNVTIDIPNYNPATGMVAGQTYAIKVSVSFNDVTSSGKQVKISLPEGLRYHVIPVTGTPAPGTPQQVATSPFYGFIESFVAPTRQPIYRTFNGDLIYNLFPTTGGVEIDFVIAVDENLYYGPKVFTQDAERGYEGITVTAQKAGSQIGEAKMDINAVGNVSYPANSASPGWREITALENSSTQVLTPNSQTYRAGSLYDVLVYNYVKKAEQTYYFPKEVNYVRSNNETRVKEINQTQGYVKFESNNYFGSAFGISSNLYIDTQSVNPGQYEATDNNNITLTMYDGTIKQISSTFKLKVNVVDSSVLTNKLKIIARNTRFFEVSENYTTPVRFGISNDDFSIKKGQFLEFDINEGFLSDEVVLPVSAATISKIEYKTNKNNTIQVATGAQIQVASAVTSKITKSSLGLAQDEYITFVKVALPDIPTSWDSGGAGADLNRLTYPYSPQIRGKLEDGVQSSTVVARTYALDANNEINQETVTLATANITRDANPKFAISPFTSSFSITAGNTQKNVSFKLTALSYFYGETVAINNPSLYIRIPQGVLINPSSITAVDSLGKVVPITVSNPYTSTISNERFIEVKTQGAFGSFINGNARDLEIKLDYSATLSAGGNYNWDNYAFWMNSLNIGTYGVVNLVTAPKADSLDVNNNGNVTEIVYPSANSSFSITKNENLIIDTFITPEGEDRRAPFDGSSSTAVGFTPGTSADYTLDILNNRPNTVDSVVSYVPIPKEGTDFGTSFQNNPFKWNMKLGAQPTVKIINELGNDITSTSSGNYVIEYSTDATNSSNWESATYSTTFNENATMIRVTNTSGMPSKERAIINFEYVVDETPETVEATPSKLSSINDFRPMYDFAAGVSSGRQFGTRVGAQLVIGEVKGRMFKDVDYDGIYTEGTDLPLSNRDVKLYNSSNVLIETVQTSATGTYSFDGLQNGSYRVDFNDGISGDEMFTFANRGADSTLNSHVANSGADVGQALTVDPTSDRAKNVNAGVFNYDPATQLSVTASEESVSMPATNVQTSFTRQVNRTISPTFFNSIRATTNGEVWSSDNTSVATVTGGLIKGVNPGTTTVRVKITDIFGNTAEDTVTVVVTTNDLPVITANDITIEKGSTFDPLASPTASDTEDGDLTAEITLVSSDVDANVLGDYSVTVRVQDSHGNVVDKTYGVSVEDTTAPIITANATQTYERLATVSAEQFLLDVEASMNEAGTLTSDFASVVDLAVSGDYTVTITGTDASNNVGTKTVTVSVEDTTAPIITANASQTYERLSSVSAEQFLIDIEASINEAGTLTSDFASVVDLDVSGDYTVTISATDTAGNTATKTVTVSVEDTTNPVVTANPFIVYERLATVSAAQFLIDVNASMNEAGTITSDFASVVNLNRSNVYNVTITGSDLAGNTSTTTVAVTVRDTTPGSISALNNVQYERLSSVSAEQFLVDVEASMNEPGTITSNFNDVVNLAITGSYEVTLTGTDEAGNVTTRLVMVIVSDGTGPKFTYNGEIINFEYNVVKNYERLSTVTNEQFLADIPVGLDEEGTITTNLEEAVNLNIAGEYQVRLTGKDLSNNETSILVSVIVIDTVDPVLSADESITYERLNVLPFLSLEEQFLVDINAQMNEDGIITSDFSEKVKMDVAGKYTVILTATDLSGNTSTKEVEVIVEDTIKPEITAKTNIKYPFGKRVSPEQFLKDVNASMNEPGKLTSNYKDVVKYNKAGKYTVTITATDLSGNVTTVEVIVEILPDGSKENDKDLPDSGNNNNLVLVGGLILVASSTLLLINRRERNKK